jgi:hypothetical protein
MTLTVEYCGESFQPDPLLGFEIGRDGDLKVDDNPYLHRHFLRLGFVGELWVLTNVGSQLSATVTDGSGSMQAWLAPGARLPIVFPTTVVLFTAGPTTYKLGIGNDDVPYGLVAPERDGISDTTIGPVSLTPTQKQLIVALAEPLLRREGASVSAIPSSRDAATRLGWEITRFNRKLDNVCDKLDRRGVRGLRGGPQQLAVNRRARLVEHAVATRLVTAADLRLLDVRLEGE